MRWGTKIRVPVGFRRTFVNHGRKAIERRYGASNAVLETWIAASGGQALLDERAAVQTTGRKAGGDHAHRE